MPNPILNNGMTSAAAAMQLLERRQQVLANNLANANTRGFKAETAFSRMIGDAIAATDTAIDLTQGSLTETHNPLDLSVQGDGFFVIQAGDAEHHTRGGNFQLNEDRQLTDAMGNLVLGEEGPITLPVGKDITVSADGQIRVDTKAVAQLRLERVDPKARLTHEGNTQFVVDPSRQPVPLAERKIHQGSVEESNVNTMAAMTEMIEVMQRYGSAQKSLATIDSIRGIAVNDLAKVS